MMNRLANKESHAVLLILAAVAVLYLLITIPASLLAEFLERKAAFSR